MQEENTGKLKPGWLLSVGAPYFSRGSDASASRKESHFNPSGFSPGFKNPVAKAGVK